MRPAVSVLLPVRNGAGTIATALRSTLAALPRNAEVLVLDDCSTDSTPAVVRSVRDRRIVLLSADAPLGVAAGLNRLLDEAGAAYIARMDADDVTLPGRFARQLRAARRGADLVFTSRISFGTSAEAFRQKRIWHLSPDTLRVWLALENPVTHPTLFARAETLRSVQGYRPGPAEDYDLWLRLAAGGARIERLAVPGLGYRIHPGQLTMGTAYWASVLRDETIAAAHDAHIGSLGWRGGSVWPILFVAPADAEQRHAKQEFWSFLGQRAADLPAFEARLLRQALARTLPGSMDAARAAGSPT